MRETKSAFLWSRIKPAEKQAVDKAAEDADMTVSEWVRVVILQKLGLVREV